MSKINQNITSYLQKFSSQEADISLEAFNSSLDGLDQDYAEDRLDSYGKNQILYKDDKPWYKYLLAALTDPFVLILLAIVLISYFTDIYFLPKEDQSWMTVTIISIMIIIAVSIQFYQEYSSKMTTDKLQELVKTTTAVKRKDQPIRELDMEDIVPGDIIKLAAGDLIPADLRILQCQDLFINQSALTGESETVEKKSQALEDSQSKNVTDLENICLMGTIVVSGSALGLVVETGGRTYFGSIAHSLTEDRGESSFEKGVKSVSRLLIRFMFIMVPIVFLINAITKKNWLEAFLFSISIAVGMTPEMLPTIVSTNLAKGANTLAHKGIIVKRLNSIQNFGAMNILCTDKTGTLTIDQIVLEKYLNVEGQEDERVLRHGYLNSYFQTGLKSLIDLAVIDYGSQNNFQFYQNKYEKVDEIPFDFERRRMSVVLRDSEGKRQLITKGAIEEMLAISDYVEYKGEIIELKEELREKIIEDVKELNKTGMRVLGIAQKNKIPDIDVFSPKDESSMVFIGYMGFLDPAKKSAQPAIEAFHKHGVQVKVLTGDNQYVTGKICQDLGIESPRIVLGQEIESLNDQELIELVQQVNIFAKMSPIQKERIIDILQKDNNVVGFLGDGINDAPSLKKADVGISVDTAVDIAKESADLILLDKDLKVLEEGVLEGRTVFGNIIKYIKMTASSNFGNVFSVLVASAFLPFLPMLPIHLLVQNLLYSISQIVIPWDNMDPEYLEVPRRWNAEDIGRFMVYIGPISSIFDIITYLIMWYVFGANNLAMAGLFQTGWFVVGLLTQTLVVHLLRTEKLPFIESHASPVVMLMTFFTILAGIIIPYTSFGNYIGFVPLPLSYFPWLVAIILGYALLTQLMKKYYIKKFDSWL